MDLILFGLYMYECTVTLWFDVEVLRGKRPFKWPIGLYWFTKYCTIGTLVFK